MKHLSYRVGKALVGIGLGFYLIILSEDLNLANPYFFNLIIAVGMLCLVVGLAYEVMDWLDAEVLPRLYEWWESR